MVLPRSGNHNDAVDVFDAFEFFLIVAFGREQGINVLEYDLAGGFSVAASDNKRAAVRAKLKQREFFFLEQLKRPQNSDIKVGYVGEVECFKCMYVRVFHTRVVQPISAFQSSEKRSMPFSVSGWAMENVFQSRDRSNPR